MSEVEEFYYNYDKAETKHIYKHLVRTSFDTKSLDVKIMELKEQPDNIQLLFDIMAMIYYESEEIVEENRSIKDLDVVNYVLASALKADKIPP